MSDGKLIQGAEKILDAGYDALGWVKDKILDAGKWAVGKGREYEKMAEEKCNTASSSDVELNSDKKEVDSAKQPVKGGKVEAELRRRESSADREQSPGIRK